MPRSTLAIRLPEWVGGHSSMVEPQPSKLMMRVRSPLPAPVWEALTKVVGAGHARCAKGFCSCSSGVEHTLGKGEVDGSNPSMSSKFEKGEPRLAFLFFGAVAQEGVVSRRDLRYHGARCCACCLQGVARIRYRPVAQLAEQRSPKPQVGGSIPSWPASLPQVGTPSISYKDSIAAP